MCEDNEMLNCASECAELRLAIVKHFDLSLVDLYLNGLDTFLDTLSLLLHTYTMDGSINHLPVDNRVLFMYI